MTITKITENWQDYTAIASISAEKYWFVTIISPEFRAMINRLHRRITKRAFCRSYALGIALLFAPDGEPYFKETFWPDG